jgi:hypothetical protein
MKTRSVRQAAIASLLAGVTALPLACAAHASTCMDQVRDLADRYHVTTKPPKADAEGGRITPEQLSKSGGVVKPPPVADKSVIAPSHPSSDRMPTLPDVAQSTPEAPKAQAVERASLQSLLMAAREQAENGLEAQCLDRLHKAHELLARQQ